VTPDRRSAARAAPWRRVYYGWWMVAGLAVTELVSWGVLVYAFSVLVVPMRAELGWSTAQRGGAYATGLAVSGLLAAPGQPGRRRLAGLGAAAFGGHSATLVGASALTAVGAYALYRAHRAFTTEAAAS
jgi:hypothetical protein